MRITPFWTRQLKTLSMVLSSPSLAPSTHQIDASFDEADAMPSSVSSGFLWSVSPISDHSILQLAPSIKSHKLWCLARDLLLHVPQAGKMSTSMLICFFSSHPAAFCSQSSLPSDNITLNPSNKRIDQSPSDFQTGIGAAANATLDAEQLFSYYSCSC